MRTELKKAHDFLDGNKKHIRNIALDFVNLEDARVALKILAEDLKLHAVRAFCKNCEQDANGCADTGGLQGHGKCWACEMYLDTYEDENTIFGF